MDTKEVTYLLSLAQVISMRQKDVAALLDAFGSAEAAWKNDADWEEVLSLSKEKVQTLRRNKGDVKPETIEAYRRKIDLKVTCAWDDDFPEFLNYIESPPFFLYYLGTLPNPDCLTLAVVGARKYSDYGKIATDKLVTELVERANVQIINGMAEGVDGAALKAALRAGGHATAVLGTGIDIIYPAMHRKLYGELKEKGCILTEYPLGMQGMRQNFPARNRIVTGISDGVLVTEARLRSGTIHSVRHGLEQGKNVYAMPGPIYSSLSELPHYLLQSGQGKFAACADDILEDYVKIKDVEKNAPPQKVDAADLASNPGERSVVSALQSGRRTFDELMEASGLSSPRLTAFLTRLELENLLRETPGNTYMLIR